MNTEYKNLDENQTHKKGTYLIKYKRHIISNLRQSFRLLDKSKSPFSYT